MFVIRFETATKEKSLVYSLRGVFSVVVMKFLYMKQKGKQKQVNFVKKKH
jgi:hypothetical protein